MNKNNVSLYKSGKFYNAFGDDGRILHYFFGYKFVEYKQSVGFPETALPKIKSKLEEENISYKIYEKEDLLEEYKGMAKNYNKTIKTAIKNNEIEGRLERLKNIIDECDAEELERILEVIESGEFKQR